MLFEVLSKVLVFGLNLFQVVLPISDGLEASTDTSVNGSFSD